MTGGLYSHGLTVEELFAPQVRCSYPSKVCMNPRATKLCGSLHKLCEFHRKRANTNQKRLQQRRRVVRAQMASRSATTADSARFVEYASHDALERSLADFLKTDVSVATTVAKNGDELSVFDSSFLECMFAGGYASIVTTAATTDGCHYGTDQATHGEYEPFSFELWL